MIALRSWPLRLNSMAALLLACSAMAAGTRVGDIVVNALPAHPGNTHCGYTDHRFIIENKSSAKTHRVTISLPKNSFGSGDTLSQLSRTIEIGPGSRMTVSIPQLPLDMSGSSGVIVNVAGGAKGSFEANRPTFDPSGVKSVLLSRSINEASLSKLHGYHSSMFNAAQAGGPPNAVYGSHNIWSSSWIPGVSTNKFEWIELDFGDEIEVAQVDMRISMLPASAIKLVELKDKSGKVVATYPGPTWELYSLYSYNISATSLQASQIRLEFDKAVIAAKPVCLDAVAFISQTGVTHWAKTAKASSAIDFAAFARLCATMGASTPKTFKLVRAETEPALWSDTWLGYTPFGSVLLAEADFKDMPATVESAILDYVASGGQLIVIGNYTPLAPWKNRPQRGAGYTQYNVGFGELLQFHAVSAETLTQAQNNQLVQALGRTRSLLPENIRGATGDPSSFPHGRYPPHEMDDSGLGGINAAFPVVDKIEIPTVGILLIMFLYILVVGPINLILLHVKKRRIWTLWTIPAFALATSLVILFYSLASEGVRSTLRIECTTLLDQANRRAYTTGLIGIYAPLTPGSGLRFDYNTEVTPLIQSASHRSGGTARTADWTTGQHLQKGWVQSRTPAHFGLRKPETRRERITLERDPDGALAIVNGLGTGINKLWVRDEDGTTHQGGPVTGGARSKLTRTTDTPTSEALDVLSIIQREKHTNSPPALIRSSYYAILDSAPFLEIPLPGKPKLRRTSSVYGLLETAP